jgi:hypothetical protein
MVMDEVVAGMLQEMVMIKTGWNIHLKDLLGTGGMGQVVELHKYGAMSLNFSSAKQQINKQAKNSWSWV